MQRRPWLQGRANRRGCRDAPNQNENHHKGAMRALRPAFRNLGQAERAGPIAAISIHAARLKCRRNSRQPEPG